MVFHIPAAERNIGRARDEHQIRWIVLHSTEGSGFPKQPSATGVAHYFQNPDIRDAKGNPAPVSSHVIVDDIGVIRSVPDDREAYTVEKANPWTLNVEIAGFRNWSREQWLNHPDTLSYVAAVIASWSRKHGIPLQILSQEQLELHRATSKGVTTHEDINKSYHGSNGDHGDPGPNFPYDVVMSMAGDILDGPPEYMLDL